MKTPLLPQLARLRGPMLALVAAATGLVAAMITVTVAAVRLEAREFAAQSEARRNESLHLALWRMEGILGPLIAEEASRPYFHYQSVIPADRPVSRMWQPIGPSEPVTPSPLVSATPPWIRLYFVFRAGELASPQVPPQDWRDGLGAAIDDASVAAASRELTQFAALQSAPTLKVLVRSQPTESPPTATVAVEAPAEGRSAGVPGAGGSGGGGLAVSSEPAATGGNLDAPARSASAGRSASGTPGSADAQQDVQRSLSKAVREGAVESLGMNMRDSAPADVAAEKIAPQSPAVPGAPAKDEYKVAVPAPAPAPTSAPAPAQAPTTKDFALRRQAAESSRNIYQSQTAQIPAPPPAPQTAAQPPTTPPTTPSAESTARPSNKPASTPAPDALARKEGRADSPQSPDANPAAIAPLAATEFEGKKADKQLPSASRDDRTQAAAGVLPDHLAFDPQSPREQSADAKRQSAPELADALHVADLAPPITVPAEPGVRVSALAPIWRQTPTGPELTFTRTVTYPDGSDVQQGFWVNWPRLRDDLLAATSDLTPSAALVPVAPESPPGPGSLANIPADLIVDPAHFTSHPPVVTPLRTVLILVWIVVLGLIGFLAFVLREATDLAERRGRFASSVTHELRTPLTTFRLYSQMLADGMVTDESARREYLSTLQSESIRLSTIIENVLEYARLGRGRRASLPPATLESLLAPALTHLSERAAAAGFELRIRRNAPADLHLSADPAAVERILLNLIDNACKYAAGALPQAIDLDIDATPAALHIRVRDHGPGIAWKDRRRIFEPYFRGQSEREIAQPGVGLGLALARALATHMGASLVLERPPRDPAPGHSGACFLLSIPLAP